jgi:predicted RNA binding protein YcfA (HicA-like mRNA interferase family)
MPRLTPISWKNFVKRLRELGFEGPYAGGKHPQMLRGDLTVIIPNPHEGDIGVGLLSRLLRQAGVSREEWLGLQMEEEEPPL